MNLVSITALMYVSSVIGWDEDIGGFLLTEAGIEPGNRQNILECPTSSVIKTRYRCKEGELWKDCYRSGCCPGYNFVLGRCYSENEDPCALGICPQKCSIYFGRVVCTCFSGYYFDKEAHSINPGNSCLDVDECASDSHGCEHNCANILGSYECSCKKGYTLNTMDNRTCLRDSQEGARGPTSTFHSSSQEILHLRNRIRYMEEKVNALNTAIKLQSLVGGQPGPEGPPGPRGPAGPPGISGDGESCQDDDNDDELDDFRIVKTENNGRQFCKCKRGSVGLQGAQGRDGPRGFPGRRGFKGQKGASGSFDFVGLMIADLRHDIIELQNSVFQSEENIPEYNLRDHIKWEEEIKSRKRN